MTAHPETEPPVEHRADDIGGRYFIRLADGSEAEMTYRRLSPGTIAIDHTFTPPAHRGQNIAHRMVATAVADARAAGFRITPVCAYAVAAFRRHKEWADVLAA